MIKNCILLFCFCLISIQGLGQQKNIENLVFEGAGIRGLAYAGAVQELEKQGQLINIKKVGGTSAGAIIALGISLKMNAEEIKSLIDNTDFQKFNDGRYLFFGGLNRLNKYYGWYKGKKVLHWIEKIIIQKTKNADITFQQMHDLGYIDLFVTATCLNLQKKIILSYKTYPEMKVKDAIRISMSIPLYFEAVFVDKNGKTVFHPKNKKEYDVMIDGGLLANYPIDIFDSIDEITNLRIVNENTLGFKIETEEQLKNNAELAPIQIEQFKDFLLSFYTITLENLNRQHLIASDWERSVLISSKGIGPKIKKLSKDQKNLLLQSGQEATKRYLDKKE